jgi:hypothetical protein
MHMDRIAVTPSQMSSCYCFLNSPCDSELTSLTFHYQVFFLHVAWAVSLQHILHIFVEICDSNKNISLHNGGKFITRLVGTILAETSTHIWL